MNLTFIVNLHWMNMHIIYCRYFKNTSNFQINKYDWKVLFKTYLRNERKISATCWKYPALASEPSHACRIKSIRARKCPLLFRSLLAWMTRSYCSICLTPNNVLVTYIYLDYSIWVPRYEHVRNRSRTPLCNPAVSWYCVTKSWSLLVADWWILEFISGGLVNTGVY